MLPRSIINGGLLCRFNGQRVSIIVNIQDIDSNGRALTGKTTDDQTIRINLSEPVNSPIEDWVEVIGIADSNSVKCEELILFEKKEDGEPFDTDAHNMLVMFLNNIKDVMKSG